MAKPTSYAKMRKVRTVTIRGKKYHFRVLAIPKRQQATGLTDHPETKHKTVRIDPNQTPKEMLATLIDEFIHCGIWELDNEIVGELSESMANALWRCGVRFPDEEN